MIKLFVSDMDGTLLNEDHVINDVTAQAVKDLQQVGIEFMIATGRAFRSAKPLLDAQNINCKMINLNGAAVYDHQGKAQSSIPMNKDTIFTMFDFLEHYQTNYSIMTEDMFYVADKDKFIKRMQTFFKKVKIEHTTDIKTDAALSSDAQFMGDFHFLKELSEYEATENNLPLKLMILSNTPTKLQQFQRYFNEYSDIDITSSSPDNLEITHQLAQKGLAVKDYVQSQGYSMNEVATIGDSLNDRSMLKMAGHSYAMENASPEVKAMAKYLAPSHREDGVAQVIHNILDRVSK